jgi:hypothetical protein
MAEIDSANALAVAEGLSSRPRLPHGGYGSYWSNNRKLMLNARLTTLTDAVEKVLRYDRRIVIPSA